MLLHILILGYSKESEPMLQCKGILHPPALVEVLTCEMLWGKPVLSTSALVVTGATPFETPKVLLAWRTLSRAGESLYGAG
jgi:hypothetical protein